MPPVSVYMNAIAVGMVPVCVDGIPVRLDAIRNGASQRAKTLILAQITVDRLEDEMSIRTTIAERVNAGTTQCPRPLLYLGGDFEIALFQDH